MNDEKSKDRKLSTLEIVAVASSVAIVGSGLVYWYFQILSVLELLEMAYG